MGKNPPKWLPGERVNETILLQRKSVEQLRADRHLRRDKLQERRDRHKEKIDAKRKRKLSTKKFISAQTILKHALRKEHQAKKFSKVGEKVEGKQHRKGSEALDGELQLSPIVLIVRAKGKLIPKEVADGFRKLGLEKLYAARLVHLNAPSAKLVQQLRPFSIVGTPTSEHLEALVRTHGCFWNAETQSRKFISGNMLIEQTLGQHNILCVEDLVDAIIQKTAAIDEVLRHIAPFDFHPPRQLFMERHRTVHQKLEIVNPDSFAAFLQQQLSHKKKAPKEAQQQKKPVLQQQQQQPAASVEAIAPVDAAPAVVGKKRSRTPAVASK